MKKIILLVALFLNMSFGYSQVFNVIKKDCNITFVNVSTSKVWYSYDLYQAVIVWSQASDPNFTIGDNQRTNTFAKGQVINFSGIPIIIDSFYSWKMQCIDLHKGGGGGSSYYLYSENYDAGSFYPSTVTGLNAESIGVGNNVSGDYSTTIGEGNTASGNTSIAFGKGNIASGDYSTTFGEGNTASGNTSIAFGKGNIASGDYSTTFGNKTTASGDLATSFGNESEASGNLSFVCGDKVFAPSYGEIAFGLGTTIYTPLSDNLAEETDRLFNIGNGDGSLAQPTSDAFTVLKNAKVGIDIDNFETTTSLSKLQVNGVVSTSISTINSNTALDSTNITSVILVDNKYNKVDIILPNPATMFFNGMTGRITIKSTIEYNVSKLVTIFPFGAELIDNASSFVFTTNYESIELVTDGIDWWIVSNNN